MPEGTEKPVATVRLARPEDLPSAARSFSESFHASVWARMGGQSAEAYLAGFIHDPREFMVVADHPTEGIVGACLNTMRMEVHRRAVLTENLPRLGVAIAGDIGRDPKIGIELAKRIGSGVVAAIRGRARPEDPAPVEHVEPDWPLEVEGQGYVAAYYVSPRARGQRAAARMSQFAVDHFRDQGFLWCEVHTYTDNPASQHTALKAGFRLVRKQGDHLTYRQYVGEGGPGALEVRIVDDPSQLFGPYKRLLEVTPEASGFHAWGWITAHLDGLSTPRLALVSVAGAPVAVFPLQLDGRRLAFAAERHSNYAGPAYDPEHITSALAGLRQLVRDLEPSTVDLRGLRERSPFFERARELVLAEFGAPSTANIIGCPEVTLEGGWDAVWGRRKKKHRANWRRAERKLEALGTVDYEELTDADAIVASFPAAVALYEARWEGMNVDKAFGREQAQWQAAAARALAPGGNVVMSVLRLEGEIIAFSYALRYAGVCSSYTLAHDDRYALYSPGQILLIKVLQHAAERGDPLFDFSVGDESYKDVWATGRREVFRVVWGAGARRMTVLDELKASLRARPRLRQLKREGVRSLIPRGEPRDVAWHVQALHGEPREVRVMTLGDMRTHLPDHRFGVAMDRAFRGDDLLLLCEGGRPAAAVWRASASRRARVTGEVLSNDVRDVYYDPLALAPDADLRLVLPRVGTGVLVSTSLLFPPALGRFDGPPDLQ